MSEHGGGSDHDPNPENAPDVGAGSARWMREARQDSIAASAVGGFFGGLLGKVLGNVTSAYWDARGDLRITAGGGLAVTIDRRHADHVADVIRSRAASRWYHAGTRDSELPPDAERGISRPGPGQDWDPETSRGEVVDRRDLERAADGDMAPAGLAGVDLAQRALAGETRALDAFASRRRVLRARNSDPDPIATLSSGDYEALTHLSTIVRADLGHGILDAIRVAEGDEGGGGITERVRARVRDRLRQVSPIEGALGRPGGVALRKLTRAVGREQGRSGESTTRLSSGYQVELAHWARSGGEGGRAVLRGLDAVEGRATLAPEERRALERLLAISSGPIMVALTAMLAVIRTADANPGSVPRKKVLTRRCVRCGWVHAFLIVGVDESADIDDCPSCGREMSPIAAVHDVDVPIASRPVSADGACEVDALRSLIGTLQEEGP